MSDEHAARRPGRRAVIAGGLAAAAAGAGGTYASRSASGPRPDPVTRRTVAFRGSRQAGVTQDAPTHATWVGLDLEPSLDRTQIRGLFALWTDDFERLMSGGVPLGDLSTELGDASSALTLSLGIGPRVPALVQRTDAPSWLAPLPPLPIDRFEDPWRQTDLVIQVRANDPLTVGHAVRAVVDSSRGAAVARWTQRGFRPQPRPGARGVLRNSFGQLDGMVNPAADSPLVWCRAGQVPEWLVGGTSLVLRRIRMDLTTWDGLDRETRENAVGRRLADGAPLSGGDADTPVNLSATDALGFPMVDQLAHVRQASPQSAEEQILRVPYNYDDGAGERPDAGLLFAAYQADPVRQFLPIQRRLAQHDLMNLWTTPVGSAVYAFLPGALPGRSLGDLIFTT